MDSDLNWDDLRVKDVRDILEKAANRLGGTIIQQRKNKTHVSFQLDGVTSMQLYDEVEPHFEENSIYGGYVERVGTFSIGLFPYGKSECYL